jgi:tetratricopeptide (TPR) repeat protein
MKCIPRMQPRLLLAVCVFLASLNMARAQGPSGSQSPEIHGEVQHTDGTPFGDGILVKIEYGIGGLAAQVVTDSRGKFDVVLQQSARVMVTVHAPGFQDASEQVDLESVPREYIDITLRALPSASGKPPSGMVSTADLNIPEAARTEMDKGRLLLDNHKPADSVKPLLKAIQIAPAYSQAHFLLGTAYMDTGKWSDAESELGKAVFIDDKLGPADLALGSSLIEEKKFADAEKPLVRGLELVPDDAQGHYDLGRTYYTLNRFPDAEERARKSIALAPGFAEAHLLLGNVMLRQRDGAHALAEFQEYLRLAPDGPFAGPAQELVKKLQVGLADAH